MTSQQTLKVEFQPQDIASPKRSKFGDASAIADWYGYYAGYSVEFVRDIISVVSPPKDGLIVDPWNGAGTTTATSSLLGYHSFGSDLNPVMFVLSRARSAKVQYPHKLVDQIRNQLAAGTVSEPVPLAWLSEGGCGAVGRIRSLVHSNSMTSPTDLSDQDCLVLTALFMTLKVHLASLRGTNPTWWKKDCSDPLDPPAESVFKSFLEFLRNLLSGGLGTGAEAAEVPSSPTIAIANSSSLPLANESASLVITSPPYLTRLDYVKAMLVELSVLGTSPTELRKLRTAMTGSVMGGTIPSYNASWGSEARAVLDHAFDAAEKRGRADAQYYAGTFCRYFNDIYLSMVEMNRVLQPDGTVAIVVQGSRHRGRIIDLPQVVQEMGLSLGWETLRAVAWPTRDLGRINPRTRRYGHQTLSETAILLRKR